MKFLFIILIPFTLGGATYFVDFAGGNDAAAGTSQGAPWKTLPGTRNTADSGYVSATYGGTTITTGNRVPAGTVFKLKGGATCGNVNSLGKVMIDNNYYVTTADLSNPITIQKDTTWGSGVTVFDGASVTTGGGGFGIIHVKVGGINLDGATNYGILIANSANDGISQFPVATIPGPLINSIMFSNNGTAYQGTESASAGNIQILYSTTGMVSNCKILGSNSGMQGIECADSGTQVVKFTITNCTVQDLVGTDLGDGGIGFKAPNSQITYVNCSGSNCSKAFDNGENDAVNTSIQMIYKFINCDAINSTVLGIGLSSAGFERSFPTFAQYFVINCRVWGNPVGLKSYAGSYSNVIVHCVFDQNAQENILMHRDGLSDNNTNYCFVYNCILYKPTGTTGNMDHGYWADGETIGHYYSDYNAYIQNGTEPFCQFGNYGGGSDVHNFSYGANGPGHGSGTWFAFNSWGNDAHSKGTGASDTTAPPWVSESSKNFNLTAHYAGVNLSAQPWYVAEIGIDRNGVARTSWDIGAFEFQSGGSAGQILSGGPISGGTIRTQ